VGITGWQNMYDKLIFHCSFGSGDLFESREFIKEIMQIIPANEYFYAHGKNKRMFEDIQNLQYTTVTEDMVATDKFKIIDNTLLLNTWIGRDGKYVLSQVGCVISKNYEMFNDILSSIGVSKLSRPYLDYIPQLDYSVCKTDRIDRFIEKHPEQKILVCNGIVNSMQAENFDLTSDIEQVSRKYSDKLFIVTNVSFPGDNVVSTQEIIKSDDFFDLNDISYLATKCDVIIGRKSGPFVFAHNRDVWYDGSKKSLSFTYAQHSSHFVEENTLPLQKFWSPATKDDDVIREIERVIA
jgi:hypothetical protein